ncbi:hypothetical protein [Psychrobium sp. 1_MG-2023]|uniref:hypothetical protein n=1 Tax=Psychrobium sp. 1_MG-2023 TaxID=3062624 RepID=UPI000C320F92|nr:hypothetical protein [Psychrobium sp. 1_MG-2023]MDP2562135.1 hypothetical protein [Psychrobium sp. 1_MG-2023]PKF57188.1 hypothetical protein CW748_07325 [Alteromonadales bacterium alter-6D02]
MIDEKSISPEAIFAEVNCPIKKAELRKQLLKENNGGFGVSKQHPNHIFKYNSHGDLVAIGEYKDGGFVATETFVEE